MKPTILELQDALDKAACETALAVTNGQVKRAAYALGISRGCMHQRIVKHHIDVEDFRDYIVDEEIELAQAPNRNGLYMPQKHTLLREKILKIMFDELERQLGNRAAAAKSLGVSIRTMRNHCKEMEALGWKIPPAINVPMKHRKATDA